ncbi:MAG: STAS/SEC14 domain-containing protein [Chloroflexi bacterium]|nr:STAS/SEC14 domain-containing protein [Anaerolineaceae bacterium]NMB89616.1 STAS/SEC14 domain-containing protein [Chloroflexota bacterium]
MPAFTITPVEKGILRCHHTATFSHEDVRTLAGFLHDYRGKLLVDLRDTSGEECMRNLKQFRPMMPTTAIFGANIDAALLEISESYYTHEVRSFETEEEALTWLRNQ